MTVLASGAGPLASAVLFMVYGNTWQVSTCRLVVLAGQACMLVPLVLMAFFDDDRTLGHASEANLYVDALLLSVAAFRVVATKRSHAHR